jgi:outer membrane receptor protein involved in Fe transport
MLMDVPVPYTTGFSSIWQNVGEMTNRGIELTLDLDLIKSRDWYLNFNANYTFNKNRIDKLFYGFDEWPMLNYLTNYKVGESIQFYMPLFAGINPDSGAPQWHVPGTDEVTSEYDEAALSQLTGKEQYPSHVGGFSFRLSWKDLSLESNFSWVLGKHIINNDRYFTENPASFGNMNQSKDIIGEIWEKPGDIASFPKNYPMQFDDHLLENASFLRLKNITLSYQLPKAWLEASKVMKSFRIYGTARNLFTITPYKGADPEIDSNLTYGAYPNSKQFVIGAQLTF